MTHGKHDLAELLLAYEALRKLAAAEYPEGRDLSEVAATWGQEAGLTEREVVALRTTEAQRQNDS